MISDRRRHNGPCGDKTVISERLVFHSQAAMTTTDMISRRDSVGNGHLDCAVVWNTAETVEALWYGVTLTIKNNGSVPERTLGAILDTGFLCDGIEREKWWGGTFHVCDCLRWPRGGIRAGNSDGEFSRRVVSGYRAQAVAF